MKNLIKMNIVHRDIIRYNFVYKNISFNIRYVKIKIWFPIDISIFLLWLVSRYKNYEQHYCRTIAHWRMCGLFECVLSKTKIIYKILFWLIKPDLEFTLLF